MEGWLSRIAGCIGTRSDERERALVSQNGCGGGGAEVVFAATHAATADDEARRTRAAHGRGAGRTHRLTCCRAWRPRSGPNAIESRDDQSSDGRSSSRCVLIWERATLFVSVLLAPESSGRRIETGKLCCLIRKGPLVLGLDLGGTGAFTAACGFWPSTGRFHPRL